jgi:hypothetical protein
MYFCCKAAAMVFDAEIGHYKDMSYEALSDEGLSWEERTRIFGGETVHYGELTGAQRKAKHKELDELLAKIDMKLVKLHKLGPFIEKTNLGEGPVVGWAEGYDDNGRPLRVRQYEFELPYPKALTRSVGPLLIWLYLMDGDESHMGLLKRA